MRNGLCGWMGEWIEGWGEAPFIAQRGRFPPELICKHIPSGLRLSRRYSSPKCTWTRARLGSGKPGGRLDSDGAPPGPPSSGWLTGEPWPYALGAPDLAHPFTLGLWALLVSETQDRIICAFVLSSLVFFLAFHLWVPANHNSPKLVEFD